MIVSSSFTCIKISMSIPILGRGLVISFHIRLISSRSVNNATITTTGVISVSVSSFQPGVVWTDITCRPLTDHVLIYLLFGWSHWLDTGLPTFLPGRLPTYHVIVFLCFNDLPFMRTSSKLVSIYCSIVFPFIMGAGPSRQFLPTETTGRHGPTWRNYCKHWTGICLVT